MLAGGAELGLDMFALKGRDRKAQGVSPGNRRVKGESNPERVAQNTSSSVCPSSLSELLQVPEPGCLGRFAIALVERVAARRKTVPRRRGAVAEGAAEQRGAKRAAGEKIGRKFRVRKRDASQADEVGPSLPDGRLRNMGQILLEVAVGGSDEEDSFPCPLELGGGC